MAGLSKADRYALRVARLMLCEGQVVRRSIDLRAHFGADFKNRDIDILALRLDPALELTVTVGECKTRDGRGSPDAAELLMRSAGLRSLAGAQRSFLATIKPASPEFRRVAHTLSVTVIDERDLSRREQALGIGQASPWGPLDERLWRRQQEVGVQAARDEDLKRIWWFVRSEFWFTKDIVAVKRALGALRLVTRRYEEGTSQEQHTTLRWLAHQCQACLLIALARTAGRALRTPPESFTQGLLEELSEGAASFAALREISRQADRYLIAVLRQAGLPPARSAEALGVFEPQPPPYTEPLIELIERFAAEPLLIAELPRLFDWRIAAIELGEPLMDPPGVPVDNGAARLLRLVAAFLRGQLALSPALLEPFSIENSGVPASREPARLRSAASAIGPGPRAQGGPQPGGRGDDGEPPTVATGARGHARRQDADKLPDTEAPGGAEDPEPLSPEPVGPLAPASAGRQQQLDTSESLAPASSSGSRRGRAKGAAAGTRRHRPVSPKAETSPEGNGEPQASPAIAELLLPGPDEHHTFERPQVGGDGPPSTLSVAVYNAGTVARRVVAAVGRSEAHGELAAEVPALVRAGEEAQMRFLFSAEASELTDGERVTVELTDDEGRQHHLTLRHTSDGRFVTEHPRR